MTPLVNTILIAGIVLAMGIDCGIAIAKDYLRRSEEFKRWRN